LAGLTYDAGALLAAERNDRRMWAIHRRALERSLVLTVPAVVLAQVWRGGPQPLLARLVDATVVAPIDDVIARAAGAVLARADSRDVVHATVVVTALRRGDAVLTSDSADLHHLAQAVGRRLDLIPI
jgi:hypothetical protein